ncbi:MgtC/SapB family protein [Sulfurovum sp.]|uniref:MgtC/SapB family protein n=1 Tax=Sulfurovum sp. TaxID=1969726 RepID=UPI002A367F27|nr:MgtC/SapB family protein [Sulfurovum sp.]MDY0403900.1 MgtC/SapB family protein [Sulfurovum sp.]
MIQSLVIAVILGFAIGMQRTMAHFYTQEGKPKTLFAGSRTFAMISLLGFLSGQLAIVAPYIVTTITVALVILIGLSYIAKTFLFQKMGMTTQITALIAYLLGLMIFFDLKEYAVFIGVIMIVLLESKPKLQKIEQNISQGDLNATVLLLAMTFLILPVLPNEMIGPYSIFNPYKTWLMAVIIAAISFVGYIAIKVLGNKRGILFTGIFGGLISSTAISISLSKIYLTQKMFLKNFVAAIAIASTFMFLRVLFEAYVINQKVALMLLIPYLLATFSGLLYVYAIYQRTQALKMETESTEIAKNPLQLSEAIKFGLLFGVIYGVTTLVHQYGDIGVYAVSFISGLGDVDAIALSLSQLEIDQKISLTASVHGIVIASVTNSLVKLGIVFWVGGRTIGMKMSLFYLIALGMMGIGLWVNTLVFV